MALFDIGDEKRPEKGILEIMKGAQVVFRPVLNTCISRVIKSSKSYFD